MLVSQQETCHRGGQGNRRIRVDSGLDFRLGVQASGNQLRNLRMEAGSLSALVA
jgi:hypothetical protein